MAKNRTPSGNAGPATASDDFNTQFVNGQAQDGTACLSECCVTSTNACAFVVAEGSSGANAIKPSTLPAPMLPLNWEASPVFLKR